MTVWEDLKLNHGLLSLNYQTPQDALLVSLQITFIAPFTHSFPGKMDSPGRKPNQDFRNYQVQFTSIQNRSEIP